MSELTRAKKAKEKLRKILAGKKELSGLGLTRVGERLALELLVPDELSDLSSLPKEVDGFPIVVRRVGELHAQDEEKS